MEGSPAQREAWLSAIADGSKTVGIGLSDQAVGARDRIGREASDVLTGTSLFVLDATNADAVVLADQDGVLRLVRTSAHGVAVRLLDVVDRTRAYAEVSLSAASAEVISSVSGAARSLVDAGRVLLAADTLGAAQRLLDLAIEYSKTRVQFGRPVGSFQAVKHLCAEMAAELEPCRAMVWRAAHLWDQADPDRTFVAAQCKAHVDEVGRFVSRGAIEVHGGIGFTEQSGLHLWFKRVTANRQILGNPRRLRAECSTLQGFGTAAVA